jgi:hypothetical protein
MKIYAGFIGDQLEARVKNDPELFDKPITIFYDHPVTDIKELEENKYNILFIQEPNQLFGFHDWAVNAGSYFDIIFTWGQSILDAHPNNSYFFPFAAGDYEMNIEYQINKKFEVSFMCGPKNSIYGQQMRHKIFNKEKEIQIPTKFFFSGEKRPCWNSMYHIAVENSQNRGYFTEKIIDAFISKTIPIYWGCPNINEFFNMDGVITFNNENDVIDIINNLTPEYYESKKEAIQENYIKAMEYADFVGRINLIIKQVCDHNKI